VRVEINGRSCHASNPERGVNAVEYMARIVASLPQVPARSHPILGNRSLSVIDIASEPYPSVSTIPNRCLARFDCRFLPGDSKQDVLELISGLTRDWPLPPDGPSVSVTFDPAEFTTYTGERYRVDEFAAPWETERQSPLAQRAVAALKEAALTAEFGHYHFCTNGSLSGGELGIPTLGFGPGDQHRAHVVDESVPTAALAAAARGYYQLARALSEAAA
jgi:acetylornithine deacetylase/succinyl-diaminopimelate desuccinylase-like protein